MGTELRVFIRVLIETLKSIKRAGWMNWVIISTLAAILSIFGCMFRITLGIDNLVKQLGTSLQISVYLNDEVEPRQFIERAKHINSVKDIEFISKEKAWNNLKKLYSITDLSNPLPNTLHIKVLKDEMLEPTAAFLKKIDGVEDVYYPEMIAQQMKKLSRTTTVITILFVFLLGGLTLFIISNTIQLLIQSCSREIEIMSMMGVSGWYIKTPYILQGSIYGLIGSIIALFPLYVIQDYIIKIYKYFNSIPPQLNINVVVLSILGIGIIVGASGSIISVKKFLKI